MNQRQNKVSETPSSTSFSVVPLEIEGLVLIQLALHGDERGFFTERFNLERFSEHLLPTSFVQDNHSRSAPGTLRGLHFQHSPPQGKLVGVTRGRILDVAVDIRLGSATYGKNVAVELSDVNGRLLWVPAGFAHGFCVVGNQPADVVYKVDSHYAVTGEGGIRWDDKQLAIKWPVMKPVVSDRDQNLATFADYTAHPPHWGQT